MSVLSWAGLGRSGHGHGLVWSGLVCMYVSVYMYIHVCVYVYVYVYACICVYVSVYCI